MGAFCRWYEKKIKDLQEHEQEQCGQDCDECPDLIIEDPFLRQYRREEFEDDEPAR